MKRQQPPRILDAVEDQSGVRWIRYGRRATAGVWFRVSELATADRDVFARLANAGVMLLTPTSKGALKEEIERHERFRPGLVAATPGFLDHQTFVFGDGTVYPAAKGAAPVIVTFAPRKKFEPCGTLEGWQSGLGPTVREQPIPLTLIVAALSSALVNSVSTLGNPIIELCGPPETGKTSLAIAAASVWAGDTNSSTGGGESWDLTAGALDELKFVHRDMVLILDEQNLASTTPKELARVLPKALVTLEKTGQRLRVRQTDSAHSACVVITTGNTPLGELLASSTTWGNAVRSRVLEIAVGSAGVLAHVPPVFARQANPKNAAIVGMMDVVSRNYAVAGPAFVRAIIDRRILGLVPSLFAIFETAGRRRHPHWPPRKSKMFALLQTTASFANYCGIIPVDWGNLLIAIENVFRSALLPPAPSLALREGARSVLKYFQTHEDEFISIGRGTRPVSAAEFESAAGFLWENAAGLKILIPSARFQKAIADHTGVVRSLRDAKVASTEGGRNPKLTIKSPRSVSKVGRVYCFDFEKLTALAEELSE